MRLKMLAASLFLSIGAAFAQSNDPVIMVINGKNVLRSEFEYSYNKNNSGNVIDKKTVKEYLPLFINYKLKVEEALNKKLDTINAFREEYLMYRDQQIKPTLVNNDDVYSMAYKMYESTKKEVGDDGWFMPAHIYVRLSQNANAKAQSYAKNKIDSLYNLIVKSKDSKLTFERLAKECSDDKRASANSGVLGWLPKGKFMKEFDDVMLSLKPGEISKPFQTSAGYHIMMLVARRPLETFDEVKNNLIQFIETRGLRNNIADEKIDSIVKVSGGAYTREQLLDKYAADMAAKDSNFKNLIKEYHDGLLLYEISSKNIWIRANIDTKGLNKFYKKNKKRYKWDEPRFKGIAYHAKKEEDIAAVKESLKNVEFSRWAEVLRSTFNSDSTLRIRVEKGIFKKGDNGLVDKEIFNVDDAKVKSIKNYPYSSTYGKILKKNPECMDDVKGLVTADYQDYLEKKWVEELRKKYVVEIKEDILETVNKHDK